MSAVARAGAAAALLALAACHRPARPPRDMLVRLGDDEAKSLDPQAVSDLTSLRIAADQFEGLTRFAGDGRVVPGLARSWTQSRDGLVWSFRLRPRFAFSDGVAITPALFPALLAQLRARHRLAGRRAVRGDRRHLRRPRHGDRPAAPPFPGLPELMTHPAMAALPLHRIASEGARWTADRPLVTSGPYRLLDWRLDDHMALAANPRWHDGRPAIARVEWRPAGDRLTALHEIATGAADTASDFPVTRAGWIAAHLPSAAHVAAYRSSYYYVFNTRRPPFDDVDVRRALNRGDLALARSGWVGDLSAPENFLAVHRSDAGAINYAGYRSARFDAALEAASGEADPGRRAAAMRVAEAILVADAPVLPIAFDVSRALVAPRVVGWRDNVANQHPSYTLSLR